MYSCLEDVSRKYLVQCSHCALARVVEVEDDADYALVLGCCVCGHKAVVTLGDFTRNHVCPSCGARTRIDVVQGEAA